MHLSPKDIDKLVLHNAGFVAQKRHARGLQLNYPEAVALIATQLLEFIRDGESVSTLMDKGKRILGLNDVMPGVADMIQEVQVEGTFSDGTKLVTVHQPICRELGFPELALYGSGLMYERREVAHDNTMAADPGSFVLAQGDIMLNEGRTTVDLDVTNMGDRPVQVGSHYPFFDTNAQLKFDREKAFGFRLNIPAGTAVRFEPGERKRVQLVALAGERRVYGGNNLTDGELTDERKAAALEKARAAGFLMS
ncbi:urease subunit beta [Pontibacter sp. CAU 1760]